MSMKLKRPARPEVEEVSCLLEAAASTSRLRPRRPLPPKKPKLVDPLMKLFLSVYPPPSSLPPPTKQ
eukprot:2790162-Heterocapsa_arctica.AAC.1